jgi:hypothetical protein
MKKNLLKILMITTALVFLGAGISLADDHRGYPRGHAYGHYKHKARHHYHYYAPPRPVYVEHYYRPVVVERHVYHQPVRYVEPSGFFFGISVADAGSGFSFGMSGR